MVLAGDRANKKLPVIQVAVLGKAGIYYDNS